MGLSDIAVRNARPKSKSYKLFDRGGLHLYVSKSGGKLWRLKYRFQGKEKLLSLGKYPIVTLRDARERALAAARQIDQGIDPATVKKEEKE